MSTSHPLTGLVPDFIDDLGLMFETMKFETIILANSYIVFCEQHLLRVCHVSAREEWTVPYDVRWCQVLVILGRHVVQSFRIILKSDSVRIPHAQ